jgi:hypothetical protein
MAHYGAHLVVGHAAIDDLVGTIQIARDQRVAAAAARSQGQEACGHAVATVGRRKHEKIRQSIKRCI